MRHHDRRSAPGCQEKRPDRGIRRRSGPLERRKPLRSPPVASPGTPPSAIVHTVPEFIWEMSVQTPFSLERHHGVLQGGVTMPFKLVCGERVTTLYGPERRRRFYLAVLIDRGLRLVNPDDKHAALGR